jgi:short-subunit dehydrogenase
MKKTIVILGMGPGVSLAVAERFGKEGYHITMVSRTQGKLEKYQQQLSVLGIPSTYEVADLSDTKQLIAALNKFRIQHDSIDVLMYNAVDYRIKHILDETIEDLSTGFTISVGHVLVAVRELLPELEKSLGSVLLTGGGAAIFPNANIGSISLGKAGLRNLAYQLHQALASKGIYVGTLTISGWIKADSKTHAPGMLAEKFWEMNKERQQIEIVY